MDKNLGRKITLSGENYKPLTIITDDNGESITYIKKVDEMLLKVVENNKK